MELNTIIIIGVAIIICILILKLLSKIAFKIIAIVIVGFGAFYFLNFLNCSSDKSDHQEFIMVELQKKYCKGNKNEAKCKCIINPVLKDIKKDYSKKELRELQGNKLKSLQIIFSSLNENKTQIQRCMKKQNAMGEWDDFVDEITEFDTEGKIKDLWEDLKK